MKFRGKCLELISILLAAQTIAHQEKEDINIKHWVYLVLSYHNMFDVKSSTKPHARKVTTWSVILVLLDYIDMVEPQGHCLRNVRQV